MSTLNAATEAFEMEMQDIAKEESKEAIQSMGAVDEDLGVCPLPDASPSIRQVCSNVFDGMIGDHADHNDELLDDQDWEDVPDESNSQSPKHPSYLLRLKQKLVNRRSGLSSFVKCALNFPCKTRSSMTVAVDTAWQKRGFDSLTCIGHDADTDIESLPEAIPLGIFKPITLIEGAAASFVTFDLETSDLIRGRVLPHITQMAAYELQSGATFFVYVIPRLPITSSVQQVTGIVMNGSSMTVNGIPVDAIDIHAAVVGLVKWIKAFPHALLISHNGRRFDFPVLLKTVMNIDKIWEFFDSVCGFIDSLSIFRKIYPGRKSYKQEELVHSLLNSTYDAHNAVGDVQALGKLIENTALSPQEILQHSFIP